jgi:hypothetical protein
MPKYTWPTFTGFWTCGGQHYYARARNGDYEVRDCRNHDCAAYVNQTEFYREKGPYSPWHPLTLVSLNEELKEAEELLLQVEKYFTIGGAFSNLGNIPGLKEWWAKHKPKTEREKKLEKIETTINLWWKDGEKRAQARMAEDILKALEE